jgi:hypothetical protein
MQAGCRLIRLEAERKLPVDNPTEAKVRATIRSLKSYGPCSFASIVDEAGNYLQVAGGGVTCLLERRDAQSGKHFRGYHDKPSDVFPDGTRLVFGGGEVRLARDEWFDAPTIAEAFCAFLEGRELPLRIMWRDVTATLVSGATQPSS